MHLGPMEIGLILAVVVLLFGGKRIPELARALGRASVEYKKAKETFQKEAQEIKNSVNEETKEIPVQEPVE